VIEWDVYDEPEMQALCARQIQELAELNSRHALARLRLTIELRKARLPQPTLTGTIEDAL
jgi:hypothetical protein